MRVNDLIERLQKLSPSDKMEKLIDAQGNEIDIIFELYHNGFYLNHKKVIINQK